ncbi:MAG: glucosaminidase domain-containing protein [Ktedonobacteraceae bacterium]
MPKASKQHTRRVPARNKRPRFSSRTLSRNKRPHFSPRTLYTGAALLVVVLLAGWWLGRSHFVVGTGGVHDTRYQVTGAPSVGADLINQVLDFYGSPAHGKGQALYDLGVKYGVDPVYALAFFMHESRFGTTGVAQVTLSLGNIRVTPGYDDYNGYRKYKSWEEGFEDWYKLIKVQYVEDRQLSTVDQIIPVYAPSSDNNDVTAYIQAIKDAVTNWRNGQVQV